MNRCLYVFSPNPKWALFIILLVSLIIRCFHYQLLLKRLDLHPRQVMNFNYSMHLIVLITTSRYPNNPKARGCGFFSPQYIHRIGFRNQGVTNKLAHRLSWMSQGRIVDRSRFISLIQTNKVIPYPSPLKTPGFHFDTECSSKNRGTVDWWMSRWITHENSNFNGSPWQKQF